SHLALICLRGGKDAAQLAEDSFPLGMAQRGIELAPETERMAALQQIDHEARCERRVSAEDLVGAFAVEQHFAAVCPRQVCYFPTDVRALAREGFVHMESGFARLVEEAGRGEAGVLERDLGID